MLLKNLCSFSKGIQIKRDLTSIDYVIPYLHYGDLYKKYNVKLNLDEIHSEIIKVDNSFYNSKYQINNNDIVMNLTSENYDDLGKCIIVKNSENKPFLAGMETHLIKIHSSSIIPEYLNYYFESDSFLKCIQQFITGMKVFRVKPTDILNIDISLPNLQYQQHIVDTVGSLDDKIENNNKIIERLIIWKANNYKNALSNISCQEYNLLDMVDFIGGTQPPKSEHIYDYKQGYIRFIQNRDYSSENHLTYIKESTKNKLCNEYDIMMDKYGEAGKVRFGISGAYNVALAKIDPKNMAYQEWIREFLNTQEIQQFLFNSSIASTRASVSENNLMNIKIPVPSKDYIAKFEEKHKIIIKFILKLKQENKQLEKLKKLYLSYYF